MVGFSPDINSTKWKYGEHSVDKLGQEFLIGVTVAKNSMSIGPPYIQSIEQECRHLKQKNQICVSGVSPSNLEHSYIFHALKSV